MTHESLNKYSGYNIMINLPPNIGDVLDLALHGADDLRADRDEPEADAIVTLVDMILNRLSE